MGLANRSYLPKAGSIFPVRFAEDCADDAGAHAQDTQGRDRELRYFRDIGGREVDFVVTERQKPILFVETKWSDTTIDPSLRYLRVRFPKVDTWQLTATGKKDYNTPEGIRVAPAIELLSTLV